MCVLIYLFVFSLLKLCFVISRSWSFPMFNIYLFNNLFWANRSPIIDLKFLFFCTRKFVKYFGETVIRILKLLSKCIKDPISSGETARKFVNMLLPFLAK